MSNLSLKKIVNGKTVFFNSPFTTNNELVRTGIDLNNSFYHALLLAYTEEYSSVSEDEKNEMVNKFISSLNKKITEDNWEEINSKYKIISFGFNLNKNIEAFYDYIESKKTKSDLIKNVIRELRIDTNIELFEAIFELVPFSFFKNSLKISLNDLNNKTIREYRPILTTHVINNLNSSREFRNLDSEKRRYIVNIINNFLHVFFKELETYCFNNVKENITVINERVNPFIISAVSSRFKRDLLIIDSTNKLPQESEFIQGRKSIVLLQIGDNFELIGRVMPKNNIQYEFDTDDVFIKKLNMFLFDPEKLKKKYPELVPLFKSTTKRNLYVSDSDSENERKEVYNTQSSSDSEVSNEEEERDEVSEELNVKNVKKHEREQRSRTDRERQRDSDEISVRNERSRERNDRERRRDSDEISVRNDRSRERNDRERNERSQERERERNETERRELSKRDKIMFSFQESDSD